MQSPPVLDLDTLLAPIPGDSPTGPNLRKDYSPTAIYRVLKDARTNARRLENRAIWDADGSAEKPNWRPLLDDGPKVLAEQAKDLEIAAWITEALVRAKGFAGLRDGFKLCHGLVEAFWDNLHPNPDPDEPEDEDEGLIRVAAIAGLNGEDADGALIAPILSVSIVESYEYGTMGVAAYDQAVAISQIEDPEERAKRLEFAVALGDFEQAVHDSSPDFYKTLMADLTAAQEAFEALTAALESRCPSGQAPPSSNIRQTLETVAQRIRVVAGPMLGEPVVDAAAPASKASAGATASGAAVGVDGPIRTREQAFALLRQVAQFFRETEPQSFLPWQLEECVKWGRLPLPELLRELISDESVRDALFRRVGIPPAERNDY